MTRPFTRDRGRYADDQPGLFFKTAFAAARRMRRLSSFMLAAITGLIFQLVAADGKINGFSRPGHVFFPDWLFLQPMGE